MDNLTLFSVPESQTLSQSTKTDSKRSNAIKEAKKIAWPSNYYICKTVQDLGRIARDIAVTREFAFDCETNSLYWPTGDLLCISIWANGTAYLVNFKHLLMPQFSYAQVATQLGQYFSDDDYKKYGFNLKFDAHWVERFLGIKCGYLHFDAYIASWFIETDLLPGRRGLKALCEQYLNESSSTYSSLLGKTAWSVLDPQVAAYYACHDAEYHWKLSKFFEEKLKEYEPHVKLFYDLDMPVMNMDFIVERDGFLMDKTYLQDDLNSRLENELKSLVDQMKEYGLTDDINLGSNTDLPDFLFGKLKLPRILGNSTAKPVLEKLADKHPFIPLFQEYRSLFKLKTAFVDSLSELLVDSKVFPSIRTTGTQTSRTAMESPNLQQIPAKIGPVIRRAFITEPGYMFVSKDLKGQELRILAHFCGVGKFSRVAVEGTIYEECAAAFYGVPASELKKGDERRDNGKKAWLAMQYGAQGPKIAGIFNCDPAKGQDFIDNLFNKRFPEIGSYQKNAVKFAKKENYIRGILGRKRNLHFDKATSFIEKLALEREAMNTPIQQTAAEQLKLGFMLCNQWLESQNFKTRAVLRIHDEIIFKVFIPEWNDDMDKMLDSIITTSIQMDLPFETTTEIYWPDENGISRWGITGDSIETKHSNKNQGS